MFDSSYFHNLDNQQCGLVCLSKCAVDVIACRPIRLLKLQTAKEANGLYIFFDRAHLVQHTACVDLMVAKPSWSTLACKLHTSP